MTLNDPLANVLSHIKSYEKLGKKIVTTQNNSKMIRKILEIMQSHGYIGGFEEEGKTLKINLIGKVNDTGVIKPRFKVNMEEYEKYEKRFLPAMNFGSLIISTNKGIMTHEQAKKENVGGKLISYVY